MIYKCGLKREENLLEIEKYCNCKIRQCKNVRNYVHGTEIFKIEDKKILRQRVVEIREHCIIDII